MPETLKTAKDIFLAALETEPGKRAVLLDELCVGNSALRNQVEALLRVHDEPDSLLDSPRIDVGTPGGAIGSPDATIDAPLTEGPGTVIGPYERPKVRLPGSGGACGIALNAAKVFVIVSQSPRSFVSLAQALRKISLRA